MFKKIISMNNKKSLKQKIIRSVFMYETKKTTFETLSKIVILFISLCVMVVFGGVLFDIYTESELVEMLKGFITRGEFSFMKFTEIGNVIMNEVPQWIFLLYLFGILLGCILIVSIIKNWSSLSHKVRSMVRYWFSL
jgi:hypothetical protein